MLGRTGAGPAKEFPVGSVATKILEVLPSLNLCVVSGNPETRRVLVALDGSEGSMKAVEFICNKLDRSSNEVILFHAMRSISFPETNRTQASPFNEIEKELWKEARAMIEPLMEKAKSRLMNAGFKAITSKIVTGVASRAAALIEDAKRNRMGTILVGRKGISQVEDFNIGRVCNKVIYKAENMAVWIIS